jgi:hypothetical protein
MEAEPMNPHDTPPDHPFDRALRACFESEPEPADDGFSQRVMAALPERAAPRCTRWADWALHAHWVAISLAAGGVAVLASATAGRLDGDPGLALHALIGLLVFWAWPGRWSRG